MRWYSRCRSDFIDLLVKKYTMDETKVYNWCLTLPQEFADARDYKAETTIELDTSIKLPKSFSLWEWIYSTNYQWNYGSCTSNATSHWMQILNVKAKWVKPTTNNIITPSWRDLWAKMGHDLNNVNDSWDYVEKAVDIALKEWIANEEWWISTYDWYATANWSYDSKWIEKIKRYIYNWNPVIRVISGNSITWNELSKWELKTFIEAWHRSWAHCVACVGWDEWGLRFVNSWRTNDWKWLKSRFYVSNNFLKKSGTMFNWRYWLPFKANQVNNDPEYLKRKANYLIILKALKKIFPEENEEMKKAIVQFSQTCRKNYKELNEELPVN